MIAIAAAAVAAGALAQAVTGIGFALVCAPFLIAVLGPREGVRTAVLLAAVLNAVMLAVDHRRVDVGQGVLLLVPAAAVTPVTAWVVGRVSERALAMVAGVLVVASAVALAVGLRVGAARGRLGAAGAGLVSGAMNVIGGIGGPAVALYAVNAGWPPAPARATFQAYFLALNIVALVSLGLPSVDVALVPALVLGWAAGTVVARRVAEAPARTATLAVAALGGVVSVVRALAG